jgi:hypothetical protein
MEKEVIEVIDLSDVESEVSFYCKCTESEILAFTLARDSEHETSESIGSPTLSFASTPVLVVRALPAITGRMRMQAYQRRWQAQARASRRDARVYHRQFPKRSGRIAQNYSS